MYRRVLVPLDGSKRAERILYHVENLARSFGSKIILIQVVRPPRIGGAEMSSMVLHRKETELRMKRAKAYLKALRGVFRKKGIDGTSHVAQGPVVNTIIELAGREKADLIAMTSHGRTGLSRAFYGSVAAGLLHLVDRPLLIIRSRNDS